MKLDQYLTEQRLTEAEFARKAGVYQSTIHRIRKGQIPAPATLARIVKVTEGAVQPNDFYPAGGFIRDGRAA